MPVESATLLISLVTALGGAFAWFMAWQERKRSQRNEAYRAVHQLYDQMVHQRFEHPEFLMSARDWNDDRMAMVYRQTDEQERTWARYYTYVELCIGFANAVLQAHDAGSMGDDEFNKQWKRLVRLVVAEHYPIIHGFIAEGPYVSDYLRDFIVEQQTAPDWDWTEAHERLVWPST